MIVHVGRRGVSTGTPAALDAARAQFAAQQGLHLPGFLEPALAAALQPLVDRSTFRRKVHDGIDPPPVELCLDDRSVYARLHLLVNDRRLFDAIETITGCSRIGCFHGRVYRMHPHAGHYDSWHDDVDDIRMIAMSVNLSGEPYVGGVLQLRELQSKRVLWEFHNTGFGDAIVFNLGEHLEHCLTPMEGAASKTAFAGWFRNWPQYEAWFRGGLHAVPARLVRHSA
jgi:2-oxoglutarate-Fe(II)-dependent oxygenase superfamily protein